MTSVEGMVTSVVLSLLQSASSVPAHCAGSFRYHRDHRTKCRSLLSPAEDNGGSTDCEYEAAWALETRNETDGRQVGLARFRIATTVSGVASWRSTEGRWAGMGFNARQNEMKGMKAVLLVLPDQAAYNQGDGKVAEYLSHGRGHLQKTNGSRLLWDKAWSVDDGVVRLAFTHRIEPERLEHWGLYSWKCLYLLFPVHGGPVFKGVPQKHSALPQPRLFCFDGCLPRTPLRDAAEGISSSRSLLAAILSILHIASFVTR